MRFARMLQFFRGWSDLFLTPAEVLFLRMGLYGLTRRILDWHYADPHFRPWAKELALAEICERTGKIAEAETHYHRAVRSGNAFGHLFIGDFYERQQRTEAAIQSFETALSLSSQDPPLAEQLRRRLEVLRQKRDREGA